MASTQRLQNLAIHLLSHKNVNLNNLIIGLKNEKCEKHYLEKKINHYSVYYKLSNPISFLSHIYKSIKGLKKLYKSGSKNILYNYQYPSINNITTLIAARIIGYKIIFDIVEDNATFKDYKSVLSRIRNKSSLFLFNNLHFFADGAIGISHHLVNKLNLVSKGRFPVIHIPISVNLDNFSDTNIANVSSLNNTIKIFYGGSFAKKDGLKKLLSAFDFVANEYPNIVLTLTGKGSERDMVLFHKYLSEMNNKDKVNYLGYVTFEKYLEILNRSNILCMTRTSSAFANAGFPFKLGEMLATGNPVIASKIGDVGKYLNNSSAVLIEPGSEESIKEALLMLFKNKEKYQQIGSNGRKVALKYFNAKTHSLKLYKFIVDL